MQDRRKIMAILRICGSSLNTTGEKMQGIIRTVEERRNVEVKQIEGIEIDTESIDVEVTASDTQIIEATFYGQAKFPNDVDMELYFRQKGNQIQIKILGEQDYSEGKNLKLKVVVPTKRFYQITVKSSFGDIIIGKKVSAQNVEVKTIHGDVRTSGTFAHVEINTESGKIQVYDVVQSGMRIKTTTISGDISVKLNGVDNDEFILIADTMKGEVKTNFGMTCKSGFQTSVETFTKKGDISVKIN